MNIFVQTPVYISVQDVKDSTSKSAIKLLTDDEIKVLIYKAQLTIDNYIIGYGTPYDETQTFIFPVDVDGVSTIPDDIVYSTLLVVEQIYENGDTVNESVKEVKSESAGDRSVTYDLSFGLKTIPSEAVPMLDNYKQTFFRYA